MKIILTAASPSIDSAPDPRFGRCAYFIIYDTASQEWQSVVNPALNASGGAGVWAAQFASEHHCDAIISGDFGPNAYDALSQAGTSMLLYGNCQTVNEAIERFKSGQLEQISSPGKAGHAGGRHAAGR